MFDDCDIISVEVRNLSRVTRIERCNQKYTKSQLNMRLKVVLDQDRKDADPFDGLDEFISFETDCNWIVNDSLILNSFIETCIEYVIDIPIAHDVFQGTARSGEHQHVYEPNQDLIAELVNREIKSVRVLIKEPLTTGPREFDELLNNHQLQINNHLKTFVTMKYVGRQTMIHSYTLKNGSTVHACDCEFDRVLMNVIESYDVFVRQEIGVINGEPALFYPQRIEVIE